MKVLHLDLEGIQEKFYDERVLLFEVVESKDLVVVSIPRLDAIVELAYHGNKQREQMVDTLLGIGGIQQETRDASYSREGI